jgi:type II secretory pathway pseudopilin PulG
MRTKPQRAAARAGFTLVEVLIAATLSLILVGLVVQVFATVGKTASDTRSVVQMTDRLRAARIVIAQDLANVTVDMTKLPLRSELNQGYFEYMEGPDGPIFFPTTANPGAVAVDIDQSNSLGTAVPDTTAGDPDDVVMFTAQAPMGTFFYGRTRAASTVVDGLGRPWTVPVDAITQSPQAEICYFVRGGTLYRRVLLVLPSAGENGVIDPTVFLWSQYPNYVGLSALPQPIWDISFYDKFDVSAHQEGGSFDLTNSSGSTTSPMLKANTLGDLTLRQNRYGHQPWVYPFDARFWDARYWTNSPAPGTTPPANIPGGFLGLPTLRECTAYTGTPPGGTPPAGTTGQNGVARWPFPIFDPTNATPLPSLAKNGIPVAGNAAGACQYLWGQLIPFNSGRTAVAGAQIPVLPYYNVNTDTGLPLIYPSPSAGNVPQGTTVANFQPVTTLPASSAWTGRINLTTATNGGLFDLWRNPYPLDQQDYTQAPRTGALYAFSSAYQPSQDVNVNFSTRYADDVLLTNVLSFDVKAWDPTAPTIQTTQTFGGIPPGTYMPGDPGYVEIFSAWANSGVSTLQQYLQPSASVSNTPGPYGGFGFVVAQGAYVDLNYLGPVIAQYLTTSPPTMAQTLSQVSSFAGPGVAQFGTTFSTGSGLTMAYDTGCFDYENDGIDQNQDGIIDNYTNGIDDNGIGGVDDATELEASMPYPVALKGIQIKIRVFEPDSRQIREVTITQDFIWE